MHGSAICGLVAGIFIGALVLSNLHPFKMLKWLSSSHPPSDHDREYLNSTASLCRLACETAGKFESEVVVRHLACNVLRPRRSGDEPISPESVIIQYCTKFYQQYGWYDLMQRIFLAGLLNDPKLRFSGAFLFRMEDDSTILAETGKALLNLGIPYLSHAHRISPTSIDCSGRDAEKTCIYQPDFHFIGNKGYQELIQSFRKHSTPFRHRKKVVFWRGSSTGYANLCEELLRVRMCRAAEGIPWLDLKITSNVQYCGGKNYTVANHTKEIDWLRYRGIIDVDGNVNAWGLFWRLASGSVVFKVDSGYSNYYTSQSIPWVHYIPLADDLTELKDRTSIIAKGGRSLIKLETIALNAQKLTENITYTSELARVRDELNELTLKS